MIKARLEFRQALSEGASNDEALQAGMRLLKDSGVQRESAMEIMREVVDGSLPPHDASVRTAEHPEDNIPQADRMKAPQSVDTLEQERPCPICGSSGMKDGSCGVCGYVLPPEGFSNPDLSKAKEVEKQMQEQKAQDELLKQQQGNPDMQPGKNQNAMQSRSSVRVTNEKTSSGGGTERNLDGGSLRNNEKPILPPGRLKSDKPKDITLMKDHNRPVESKYRIVSADAPDGLGADARVKADGKGGVGLDSDHAKKDNVSREVNVTGDHTDTWSGNQGDSLGQQKPVTDKSWPNKDSASKEAGPSFPDHEPTQVDLMADIAEEVGDRTMTWGDDDGHVGDPVTKKPFPNKDSAVSAARAQMLAALKLAETEVAMGITEAEQKFARIAALESETINSIEARLDALMSAHKAKVAAAPRKVKQAQAMPSLSKSASYNSHSEDTGVDATGVFW